jgi:hypothetical protein
MNRILINSLDKDKWIDKDRLRWARAFSIPMTAKLPDGFPEGEPPTTLTVSFCDENDIYDHPEE